MSGPHKTAGRDWFGAEGLRFSCTQCGNCCTGPEGYVIVSNAEVRGLADRLGMSVSDFEAKYTRVLPQGRSLTEHHTEFGYDCVFLDRETIPGKAVCGVYEHRPEQCRTWPFWKSNLQHPNAWKRAASFCPGMNTGQKHTPEHIRLTRDRSPL
ncbi:MAG: YkgJ family cysteine cluster protein [Planctomycetota bacterium]